MKKISIFLTTLLLITGVLTTSLTAYAIENKTAAVTASETDNFHREQELLAAKELAGKLNGKSVEITAKLGVDGKFFGSVTTKDISNAIESKYSVSIDKRNIVTPEIKRCGNYDIKINLYTGVVCNMIVVVK